MDKVASADQSDHRHLCGHAVVPGLDRHEGLRSSRDLAYAVGGEQLHKLTP